MAITKQTKKTLLTIILAQCAGLIFFLFFNNGFILTYLSQLEIPSYHILFLLSLIPMGGLLFTLPFAYLSDRLGKKKIGQSGLISSVLGMFILIAAGSFKAQGAMISTIGIAIISLGFTAFGASWLALLSPIIPEEIRGRFFGILRVSWQLCGIAFTLTVTALLTVFTTIHFFQYVLLFGLGGAVIRICLYQTLPELEPTPPPTKSLFSSLLEIMRTPGYLPFCAYMFLITLFTGAIPWVIGLLGKDILLFSDSQILLLGNAGAAGAVIGFYLGGKMVDKIGTKSVFLICHIGFSIILLLTALRGIFPFSDIVTLCLMSGFFGITFAASSIAILSELMAIIPVENKSLSTGFHVSLYNAGLAFSSLLIGQALKHNVFASQWTLFGQTLSAYDTILVGSAIMILLLLITLGLIPSVIQVRKAQWGPLNR